MRPFDRWPQGTVRAAVLAVATVLVAVCVAVAVAPLHGEDLAANDGLSDDQEAAQAPQDSSDSSSEGVSRDQPEGTVDPDAQDAGIEGVDPSTTPPEDTLEHRLDLYLEASQPQTHVPGVAVAVVDANGVVYERVLGDVPDANSPLLVGSLSKSFTAACVMQLVEAGEVDLDAPAARYLARPGSLPESITVRDLLNQTSGLGYYDSLADALSRSQLGSTAGSFSYSNANYDVLGRIIEDVSGQSYASYLKQHVFEPLGMGRSSGDVRGSLADGTPVSQALVPGHRTWFGVPVADGFTHAEGEDAWGSGPSGYVAASLGDMETYLRMYLSGGAVPGDGVQSGAGVPADAGETASTGAEGVVTVDSGVAPGTGEEAGPVDGTDKSAEPGASTGSGADGLEPGSDGPARVLSADSVNAMFYDRVPDPDGDTFYGMGWTSFEWDGGETVLSHDGSVEGYCARMVLLPDRGMGIIVMGDASDEVVGSTLFFSLADGVVAAVAGDAPEPLDGSWYVEEHTKDDVLYAAAITACAIPLVWVGLWRRYLARGNRHLGGAVARLAPFVALPALVLALPSWWGMPWRDLLAFVPDVSVILIACAALLAAAGVRRVVMLARVSKP